MSTSKTISREKIEWLHNVATSLVGKETQIGMLPEEILRLTTALLTGMSSVPVYQMRRFHISGKKQLEYWTDIDEEAYQYLRQSERRVVYAAPPAPEQETD